MRINIIKTLLNKMNYWWQNFIEDMFGMGNFSCPSYQREIRRNLKNTKTY